MLPISITIPSIRVDQMKMVIECIKKQDFEDYEVLIGTPAKLVPEMLKLTDNNKKIRVLAEPEKRVGDFINLYRCWNMLFKEAKGELIVNIVDGIWFPSDILTMFWDHYKNNPMACIGGIGHQYSEIIDGKPQVKVWRDPRDRKEDYGSFWEIEWLDFEMCLVSVPRQAIIKVGGMDSTAGRFASLFEKEMCARIAKLGYHFFLDASLEYRALRHERIGGETLWNQKYQESFPYFDQCIRDINDGKRLNVHGLEGD